MPPPPAKKCLDLAERYCSVLGCKNTGLVLKAWRKKHMEIHENCSCSCKEPFKLYLIPRESNLQKTWLERIGLPEFEISDASRVCSIHFVEGKPTIRSFYPTLYLQSDLSDYEENEGESSCNFISSDMMETEPVVEDNSSDTPFHILPDLENTNKEDDIETKISMEDNVKYEEDETSKESDDLFLQENTEIFRTGPDSREEMADINQNEDDDDELEILYQKPKIVPLASYDPQAQVLQISRPIEYISECHNRIAQLLAEKDQLKKLYDAEIEKLKSENAEIEKLKSENAEIEKLKSENAILKRRLLNSKNFKPIDFNPMSLRVKNRFRIVQTKKLGKN